MKKIYAIVILLCIYSLSLLKLFLCRVFHTKKLIVAAKVIAPPMLYAVMWGSPNPSFWAISIIVEQTIVINNAGMSVIIYGFCFSVK